MAQKKKGGRAPQKRLISERAVYGLREDRGNYAKRYSDKQLRRIIDQYAQVANARLKRIEKAQLQGSSPAYQFMKTAGYDKRSFATASGRFKKAGKQSRENMIEELYQLHQFIFNAKTSKIVNIRATNLKRAKSVLSKAKQLNESFALDLEGKLSGDADTRDKTLRNIGQFFNDENIRKLIDAYGSEAVLELVETLYGEADEIALDSFEQVVNKLADALADNPFGDFNMLMNRSREDVEDVLKKFKENNMRFGDSNEFDEWEI